LTICRFPRKDIRNEDRRDRHRLLPGGHRPRRLRAEHQAGEPDQAAKSAYALINYNFGSLATMAEGKKPYNKDKAARNADMIAMLADVPRGFFGEGTDKGETRAKPEIWRKRSDFDTKMDKMILEARKLPQAARADLAALTKAVDDTGAACKACHDDYRAK
jgi:cytochrome c556